ncbi:MAG TPA: erythromycin esterase family protein [Fluviicola sp.]|nr:erythromycin esterase family protein [Fluviicola sp.]
MLKKSLFFLPLIFCVNCLFSQTGVAETDFSVFKNYEIIAFGEASHGSKSDYLAREELIADLIQHTDSLDVFVEMQFYAGIAIEHYAKGLIDTTALLEELNYNIPDGLMHLINRFKDDKRITFYGIDMTNHLSALKFLKENLIASIPSLEEKITLITDSLNYNFRWDYSKKKYHNYAGTIHRSIDELTTIINSHDSLLGSKFLEVHFPFTIIQQYISYSDGYKNQTKEQPFYYNHFRDSCMAENVCSLKDFSKKQIVLLAANGHVNKAGTDNGRWVYMGGRLNRKFHDKYFVIGSQYVKGTLLEVDMTDGRSIVVHPIYPIKRTLPWDLNKLLQPKNDTLIIIASATGKLNKILNKKSCFQDFGAGRYYEKRYSYTIGIPSELFDAIYLIPIVEPSADIAKGKSN